MKRKVFVVGVGMTKFEKPGRRQDFDYPDMAKEAGTKALEDAGLTYDAIEQACVGYVYGDSTCGQRALYQLGMTGIPVYNVNNNCATGSTALVMAKQLIEGGMAECVMALGFEKMQKGSLSAMFQDRANPVEKHVEMMIETVGLAHGPVTAQMFGNAGREHMEKYGTKPEHFAKIAWKNHKHSTNNPYSQFQDYYTLEQIQGSPQIHDPLTKLQCCPTSDGSAAAILCSEEFVRRHNLQGQAVEILAMEMATDLPTAFSEKSCIKMVGYDMTKKAADEVFRKAGLTPEQVQVVELHDCFSCNELITYEALGLCSPGKAGEMVDKGDNTYGGKYVVNPSGGLISKGHPLGATGLAQCAELCWQLRGMAAKRQVPGAKVALQHNIGLGGAAVVGLYRLGFPAQAQSRIQAVPASALAPETFKSNAIFNGIKEILAKDGANYVKKINVTMVTEFISCFSGLLMPDDEYPIYTDALLKALAAGKDGFTYLCRVLVVLLQTLLQDQISEDYQEIKVPLCDIPVNPCTTSELVRLCLRKQDVVDDKSDFSDESENVESDEVREELIQLLESQELFQLEPEQKLEILKGLCLRVMSTYSVQDYMEEKQQELSRLWKEKNSLVKEENKKKKGGKQTTEKSETNTTEAKDAPSESSNLLLTSFYGKKGEETTSGNSSETAMDVDEDDGDLISTLKRRRMQSAKMQEEKRRRELEKKKQLEKELILQKEQKEREQFEKQFIEGMRLAKVTLRQVPIGTDRNHSRYWVFSDITPGLYVEKGWAGESMLYSCRPDNPDDSDEVSISSEEEEEQEETGDPSGGQGKKGKQTKKKCLDKTFPHQGQNLWFLYDNMKDVDALIESLHANGTRENKLKKELQKRYSEISSAIFKLRRSNLELLDCDGEKKIADSFKKELMETEMRLRNGGLGGVDDFQTWCARLETAVGIPAMADCLIETQKYVVEKFRDGIMAAKQKKKSEVKEEEEEDGEDQVPELAVGIQRWRDAVNSANSMSRLHVLLGILDSCIKWEKSAENAKCKICRKKGDEDRLLLCDDCNQAFHMYCLRPALTIVPQEDWHCPACAPQYRKRTTRCIAPVRDDEDTDEDENIKTAKAKSIKHETMCAGCGGDENLIECAECPGVYHLECHDPPLRHPPRGRWVCNDCKTGVTARKNRSRNNRRAVAQKRKRIVENSSESEEEESEEEEDEPEDEDSDEPAKPSRPPPKKQKRTSGAGSRGSRKSDSPKGRSQSSSRRSAPSPDMDLMVRTKISRRAPSELSLMEDIINRMLEFKQAWPFYDMVNKRDVPDYYIIIKQPISFQKIKDRLNCLVYGSPQEVIEAVELLFRNAVEYNKVGSEVYDCIEISEKYFVDQLKKHLPFYAYNRNSVPNGHVESSSQIEGRRSSRGK